MEHPSTATGRVTVGTFVLDVSSAGGTRICAAAPGAATDATPLRESLSTMETTIEQIVERGVAEADEEIDRLPESLEKASTFTDRVEQAVDLAIAIGEGRVTDVVEQIDGVLDLADQLHRAGRYEDELRVLRALYRAVVLTLRWLALVEVLRRVLSAARAYADTHATGWVTHELGTLSVVSGDRERGVRLLERAQSMRREAGDELGLDATNHNLGLATRRRVAWLRLDRRPRGTTLALSAVAAVVLLAGGAAMAVLADRGTAPLALAQTGTTTTGGSSTTTGPKTGGDRGSTTAQSSGTSGSTTASGSTSTVTQTTSSSTTTTRPPPPVSVGAITWIAHPATVSPDATAGFAFAATNATGFLCDLDGTAVACANRTWMPSVALADGPHTFTVRGVADDQEGSPATYSWSIDTTVPVVSIQQVLHGVASYTITDSDTTPPTMSCTILDSTKHIVGSVTGCTVAGPAQCSGLVHGVYVFIVSATDPAGHTASDSRSFKV